METSGPLIEELPDDYEEDQHADERAHTAASSSAPRTATGSGLRRGFFSSHPKASKQAEASGASADESSKRTSAMTSAATAQMPSNASVATRPPARGEEHEDNSVDAASDVLHEPDEIVSGLRARLTAAARSAGATEPERLGDARRRAEARVKALATQAKWPTTQAKSSKEKAAVEADACIAEIRSSCNDARRLRNSGEKRAMAELKRTCEDATERVRKVADSLAPKGQGATQERERAVVAAFHALPLTAKLRVIADDWMAISLMGGSFLAGTVLALGAVSELYTAWNCGVRCGH